MNVITSKHNKQRATPSRFFKIKAETTGTKRKRYKKTTLFFFGSRSWTKCDAMQGMKAARQRQTREGDIREVSIGHNVTPDPGHEKKVKPAAESHGRL